LRGKPLEKRKERGGKKKGKNRKHSAEKYSKKGGELRRSHPRAEENEKKTKKEKKEKMATVSIVVPLRELHSKRASLNCTAKFNSPAGRRANNTMTQN